MDADGDLIAHQTLVEMKTNLGEKKGPSRVPELSLVTLRHVLGYLLHDVDDVYALTNVGIYEARYGALTTWPVDDFLASVAGRAIDLPAVLAGHLDLVVRGT
jgi:hypothetical protein